MPDRVYNVRPSLQWVSEPENRVSVHPFAAASLPTDFLPEEDDDIVDQLQLGACTANQMMALIYDLMMNLGLAPFLGDRLNQYFLARQREGTQSVDSGATIADTVWVAQNYGFAKEIDYNISRFTQPPTQQYLTEAAKNKNFFSASMLQTDLATTKTFIYNGDGKMSLPIIYGFSVYQQYESIGTDGNVAMPSGASLGGHANRIRGWSDSHVNLDGSRGAWRGYNCWGLSWGDRGRFWLPYNYPRWDVWGCKPNAAPTPTPDPIPTPTPTPSPDFSKQQLEEALISTAQFARMGWNYNDLIQQDKDALRYIVSKFA